MAATDEITEVTLQSLPSVDADSSPAPRDGAIAPEPEQLPEVAPEIQASAPKTVTVGTTSLAEASGAAPEVEDAVIEALEKEEEEEEDMTEEEWRKKEEELKQWVNTVRNVALHETGEWYNVVVQALI